MYKSTACQLGIHKTPGVWSLLDTLLPPVPTSLLVRRWLRRLLLLPPPTDVANSIRTACQYLSGQSSNLTFSFFSVADPLLRQGQKPRFCSIFLFLLGPWQIMQPQAVVEAA